MLEARLFIENRAYPRVLTNIQIGYRVILEQKEMERIFLRRKRETARTGDISLGGLFILVEDGLEAGQILRLYITLPEGSSVLAPTAEVVWTNGQGGGLRFITLHEEEKNQLREYLGKSACPPEPTIH